jgi:hypothetical protein
LVSADGRIIDMRVRVMLSSKNKILPTPRIVVTRKTGKNFLEDILKNQSIAEFSKTRGLSYTLIYNLAHGRRTTTPETRESGRNLLQRDGGLVDISE